MFNTFLTISQFSKKHPAFSEASLRNLIFHSKPRSSSLGRIPGNGLGSAIARVGRRVLIDEQAFFEWLEQHREGSSGKGGVF